MSKIIYKYPLQLTLHQFVRMPVGAKVLDVQYQGDQLCLWALADPRNAPVKRSIHLSGTGCPFDTCDPDKAIHLATVQRLAFVWHVFDDGEQLFTEEEIK